MEAIYIWTQEEDPTDMFSRMGFNCYAQVDDDVAGSVSDSSENGVLRDILAIYKHRGVDLSDLPVLRVNPRRAANDTPRREQPFDSSLERGIYHEWNEDEAWDSLKPKRPVV